MAQLIDKDAIVAEIEKCKKDIPTGCTWGDQIEEGSRIGHEEAYDRVLRFIDTLEVKEVDLEKEIDSVEDRYYGFESLSRADVIDIAKHFFELGLKAKQG